VQEEGLSALGDDLLSGGEKRQSSWARVLESTTEKDVLMRRQGRGPGSLIVKAETFPNQAEWTDRHAGEETKR